MDANHAVLPDYQTQQAVMPTKISSTEDLLSAVRAIQFANPNSRLAFRGQRRNLAPLPSAQRQIDDLAYRRAQAIFHSSWNQAASYLLPGNTVSKHPFQRLLASMALLQHYGFRSWFIDITSDPEIAAWFAIHKYVSDRILVQPQPIYSGSGPSPYITDHGVAVVSTARYQLSTDADGFLLVFGVQNPTPNAFSFNDALSSSALRVHRQEAGALIAPLDDQPLASSLLATFVIDRNIVLPEQLNTRFLFPPPSEDEVYKKLVRVPYLVSEDTLREHFVQGIPALIDVPLYVYDSDPEPDALSNIRLLTGFYGPRDIDLPDRQFVILPLSPSPRISYTTSIEPPNERLGPDSMNVNLRTRDSLSKAVDLSVWQSKRLWLLYPVHQMLVTFMYRDAVYPLFRGMFVDLEDDHNILLTPVAEDIDNLVTGRFSEGDEERFREDFYFLTEQLQSGAAILKRIGSELHYEWKGWENREHEDPLQEFRTLYSTIGN